MYKEALAQAGKESARWPYDWVQGVDYPHQKERGTVSGQLEIDDPLVKSLPDLLVGLAFPDAPPRISWQNDAKHYEFWVRGRPSPTAFWANTSRPISPSAKAARSTLESSSGSPYGTEDISGTSAYTSQRRRVFKGDDYFHWGRYLECPKLFPNDVTYTIGQSDYRKDWFFEQVPHASQPTPPGGATAGPPS